MGWAGAWRGVSWEGLPRCSPSPRVGQGQLGGPAQAQRGEGGAEGEGSEVTGRDVWAGLNSCGTVAPVVGLGGDWVGGQLEGASFPFPELGS